MDGFGAETTNSDRTLGVLDSFADDEPGEFSVSTTTTMASLDVSPIKRRYGSNEMFDVDIGSPVKTQSSDGWEDVEDPRGSPETIQLLNELEIEFVDDYEAYEALRRDRADSLIPPLKQSVDTAVSVAAEQMKPIAQEVGTNVLSSAQVVGKVLHDTGLDTLDTIQGIPWGDIAVSAMEGTQVAAQTIASTSYKLGSAFLATPLGQRIVGGIDTTVTSIQLKATSAVNHVLRGARDRLEAAVDSLSSEQQRLHDRLNPNGLPRGDVVEMLDSPSSHSTQDIDWPNDNDDDVEEES